MPGRQDTWDNRPRGRTRQEERPAMSDRIPHDPFVERTTVEERRYRKQRLAIAFRIFGRLGFEEGVGPYHRTGSGALRPVLGQPVRDELQADPGAGPDPRRPRRHRPARHVAAQPGRFRHPLAGPCGPSRRGAAAHSHSVHGKAFASLHRPLRPLTPGRLHLLRRPRPPYRRLRRCRQRRRRASASPPPSARPTAILANHGLITVGQSVDEAVFWFVSMERSCQAELLAMAAGEPRPIDGETARSTYAQVGTPLAGWFSAQPLFDWILAEQPDCLEDE